MTRRNKRVTLRYIFVLTAMFGFAVACAPQPEADSGTPDTVRVQYFQGSVGQCAVFTHDTAQGAAIAVWCK